MQESCLFDTALNADAACCLRATSRPTLCSSLPTGGVPCIVYEQHPNLNSIFLRFIYWDLKIFIVGRQLNTNSPPLYATWTGSGNRKQKEKKTIQVWAPVAVGLERIRCMQSCPYIAKRLFAQLEPTTPRSLWSNLTLCQGPTLKVATLFNHGMKSSGG